MQRLLVWEAQHAEVIEMSTMSDLDGRRPSSESPESIVSRGSHIALPVEEELARVWVKAQKY